MELCWKRVALKNYETNYIKWCFWLLQLFLGQKYGYRPFPPNIQADEFMTLRRQLIDDGRSVGILDAWFQRDQNVIPPVYNLMAISSVLVHYNDKVGNLYITNILVTSFCFIWLNTYVSNLRPLF